MMRGLRLAALALLLGSSLAGPAADARDGRRGGAPQSQRGEALRPQQGQALRPQRGRASYYSPRFHGRRMADGRRFNRHSNAAASRTLPLGTRARVRNLENGRSAVVVIQDRGPHLRSRVLDVSPATANLLGMRQSGTALVEIIPLAPPPGQRG